MNFEITAEQDMVRDTFARFLDDHSSTARVRAAMPSGFDAKMWQGLAELGALAMRVPETAGGMGMGLFEAVLLMEEAGRTLASGPVPRFWLVPALRRRRHGFLPPPRAAERRNGRRVQDCDRTGRRFARASGGIGGTTGQFFADAGPGLPRIDGGACRQHRSQERIE